MKIHDYYYNDDNRILFVEFSTKDDGDNFYRILKLDYEQIQFYSPDIIEENEIEDFDEDFIIDLIIEYLKENNLPEEISL